MAEASQRVAGGPVSSGSLKPGTVNRTFRRAVMRRVFGKRERQMLTAAIRASAWW
jgi:hypothetical protein